MIQNSFSVKKIVTHPFFYWPLVIAAAFVVFFIGINHESIWFDETWSLAMARLSLPEIVQRTALDNHPPLYYFMLKPFIAVFGTSETALRLPSLLGALALVGLAAGPVRRALGAKTALVFALLVTAAPIVIQMAHEARMYTWAGFFITAGLLYGFLAVRDNKIRDWVCYGICNLAGAYTHYYALVALALGGLVLLVFVYRRARDRKRRFAFATRIPVLLYLPWIIVFLTQTVRVAGGFWVPRLTPLELFKVVFTPFGFRYDNLAVPATSVIALVIAIGVIVAGAVACRKAGRTGPLLLIAFLCLVSFLTLLATALFSWFVRPILIPRYMTVCSGAFLLAVAAGLAALKKPLVFFGSLAALVACLLPADIAIHTETFNGSAREYAAEIRKTMKKGDVLLHGDMHTVCSFAYYLPECRHILVRSDERAWRVDPDFFGPAVENTIGLYDFVDLHGGIWLVNKKDGAYPLEPSVFESAGYKETQALPELNNPSDWLRISAVRMEYVGNPAWAQMTGDLTVRIGSIEGAGGNLLIMLFKHDPISADYTYLRDSIPVAGKTAEYVFRDIEYGTYAVYVLHDRNGNARLDPDVPGEGVGASVDAKLQWGIQFDRMKFEFSKKHPSIDVTVMYK